MAVIALIIGNCPLFLLFPTKTRGNKQKENAKGMKSAKGEVQPDFDEFGRRLSAILRFTRLSLGINFYTSHLTFSLSQGEYFHFINSITASNRLLFAGLVMFYENTAV